MDKAILGSLCDSRARIKYIRQSIERVNERKKRLNSERIVADSVSCGKKGKKPLGTVTVHGFPYAEESRLNNLLERREKQLKREEQKLLELITDTEEYISSVENVEMRNILSLYYVEDLNWTQVSKRMNELYGSRTRRYTDSSCRMKHERFLEKN